MPALQLALKATELNQRHSLLGLSKDGVSFEGLDAMSPKRTADGSVDHGATAKAQAEAARDFFLQAVTPDKALILGAVGAVGDEKKINYVSGAVMATVGVVADLIEAVPAAVLAMSYGVSAAVHGAMS